MTKKIGISLKDKVYEWASRQVEEGRAEFQLPASLLHGKASRC
jgi:hypothetical protein